MTTIDVKYWKSRIAVVGYRTDYVSFIDAVNNGGALYELSADVSLESPDDIDMVISIARETLHAVGMDDGLNFAYIDNGKVSELISG